MTPETAALLADAILLHRQGALAEADERFRRVLRSEPANGEALYHLAQLACQEGQLAEGVDLARRVLAVEPCRAAAHNLLGMAFTRLGRPQEALASLEAAIAASPTLADAHGNRGDVLAQLGRSAEAIESYRTALKIAPDSIENLCNLGAALLDLACHAEALASFDRVLALRPDFSGVHFNRGTALMALGRHEEALASYDKALAVDPGHIDALNRRGCVLGELGRSADALASFDRVLAIEPDHRDALNNRGTALLNLGRFPDALAMFARILLMAPDDIGARFHSGLALAKLERFGEAIAVYEQVLEAEPEHPHALGELLFCMLAACDWNKLAARYQSVVDHVEQARSLIGPFDLLVADDSPARQLACARHWRRRQVPVFKEPLCAGRTYDSERIRVAYLSSDFRQHPMTLLITELFERHDRSRFEIIGMSYGPDDGSAMRARAFKAFDRIVDVRARDDREVAEILRDLRVQIAVDLNGYTEYGRPGILARRPAPVQASYLGFPGTTAAEFMDYIIADRVVVPPGQQSFFTEKIVHLPDSYFINPSAREVGSPPSRVRAGLPDRGVVFCCFNSSNKLTEPVFDVWMRLLQKVDRSVLWLLRPNDVATDNLRNAACARGVDPARLVFAPKVSPADHLARHGLADLFLDTLPYNAHTTACDALWVGTPVVTCTGQTLAGRVAASLLSAVGLPDLVTHSLDEYEALALRFAREPTLLRSVRAKLASNRPGCPLFDTDRFRRHIEAAYFEMWEIYRRGEEPRSFSVDPIDR